MAPTTGPHTAGAIAREQIGRGADLILVAGGDGTINEAAEGTIGSTVPLGILPCGTANVLAVEAGIGLDPWRAARHLHELKPRRIAVGHVVCEEGRVSRHFLLMAGAGLYSAGTIFYRNPRGWRHAHGMWHLFVLGGTLSHYISVTRFVL